MASISAPKKDLFTESFISLDSAAATSAQATTISSS